MEPTARVPSGDAVMTARSRGTLRRVARDAGRYPALVRPAEAALVMAAAAKEEAAARRRRRLTLTCFDTM
jgi:hypothetical protein